LNPYLLPIAAAATADGEQSKKQSVLPISDDTFSGASL
jgi:hypothetical protein